MSLCAYLLAGLALVLWIASLIWIYRDAESRGKSGVLMVILIGIVAWPWGLLIWLAARPREHVLRVAPFKQDIDCPKCGMQIKNGQTACKNCGY